jgi:hypothetical protein
VDSAGVVVHTAAVPIAVTRGIRIYEYKLVCSAHTKIAIGFALMV